MDRAPASSVVLAETPPSLASDVEEISAITLQDVMGSVTARPLELSVLKAIRGRVQSLPEFLDAARGKSRLGVAARRRLVDQAIVLFERTYAHLPLKRSMHAVDPVQRLRLLSMELEGSKLAAGALSSDLQFHRKLTEIFTSVRDLHTLYLLPEPFRQSLAFLPFSVGEYFDPNDEKGERPFYTVTEMMKGFRHRWFRPGVELLYWNGVPMHRAVEVIADQHAGSNMAARRSHGLSRMTLRPLSVAPVPDEEWVDIVYRVADSPRSEVVPTEDQTIRVSWHVYGLSRDDVFLSGLARAAREAVDSDLGKSSKPSAGSFRPAKSPFASRPIEDLLTDDLDFDPASVIKPKDLALEFIEDEDDDLDKADGLDMEGEFIRRARNDLFEPKPDASYGDFGALQSIETADPSVLEACVFHSDGKHYGVLKLRTFQVPDIDAFIDEVKNVLDRLPKDGLVLDVRGNAGGWVQAGERLLQLFTPRPIEPERFQFANSTLNLDFCRRHRAWAEENGRADADAFEPWISSIERSVATGATYSRGFPISNPIACNEIGQRYYGPVVLLVDANCYSTTDMFVAGFRDHEIGPILGVHDNTGAGGASTATHSTLAKVLAGDESPYRSLPRGAEMQVALRRSVRVLENQGTPLEDLGVLPDHVQRLRKEDVVWGAGTAIYERAARILADQPQRLLDVDISSFSAGSGRSSKTLRVTGKGFCSCTISVSEMPLPMLGGEVASVSKGRHQPPARDFDCQLYFPVSGLDSLSGETLYINGWYTPEEWVEMNSPNRGEVPPRFGQQPVVSRRIKVDDVLAMINKA